MGWTCQHDYKGECKLLNKTCSPGMNGCILKKSEYIFSSGNYELDKKIEDNKKETLDFIALAKSN